MIVAFQIICVGKKLHVTLTKVKRNETYYFSLFAINNKTNFTTLYGKSYIQYNYRPRPIILKDGKRRVIDMKKHSGEVYFKFKVILRCQNQSDVRSETQVRSAAFRLTKYSAK